MVIINGESLSGVFLRELKFLRIKRVSFFFRFWPEIENQKLKIVLVWSFPILYAYHNQFYKASCLVLNLLTTVRPDPKLLCQHPVYSVFIFVGLIFICLCISLTNVYLSAHLGYPVDWQRLHTLHYIAPSHGWQGYSITFSSENFCTPWVCWISLRLLKKILSDSYFPMQLQSSNHFFEGKFETFFEHLIFFEVFRTCFFLNKTVW